MLVLKPTVTREEHIERPMKFVAEISTSRRRRKVPFRELSRVESRSPDPKHAPEKQEAGYQEDISDLNSGPRIRLRVSQPKITLRLKLPATRQAGMKKNRGGKTKTERKGTRRGKGKNGIKSERAKKGKRRTIQIGRKPR